HMRATAEIGELAWVVRTLALLNPVLPHAHSPVMTLFVCCGGDGLWRAYRGSAADNFTLTPILREITRQPRRLLSLGPLPSRERACARSRSPGMTSLFFLAAR